MSKQKVFRIKNKGQGDSYFNPNDIDSFYSESGITFKIGEGNIYYTTGVSSAFYVNGTILKSFYGFDRPESYKNAADFMMKHLEENYEIVDNG